MSVGPKEELYDDRLSPLVFAIIELCKEHSISTCMHFELDDYDDEDGESARCLCTSSIPIGPDGDPGNRRIANMRAAARTRSTFVTMTVTSTGKGVEGEP
jgi:hypothetical protein